MNLGRILYAIRYSEQFEYGVWKSSSICRAVKRSLYENSVIEVDLHTHGMKVYKNNQLVETMEPCVDCIDMNAEGKRWEGSVREWFAVWIWYPLRRTREKEI